MYMAQINLNVTKEFEEELATWMKVKGIPTKSEALRVAVREGLARARESRRPADYTALIGAGKKGFPNPHPRFKKDGDLW